MTWSTPERCQTEVLLTVCGAIVVSSLGRVATAHQIAPWSRGSDLLSPTAVGAAFRSTSVGGFGTLTERHGHCTETQIKYRHSPPGGECRYSLGWSWSWPGRAVSVPNPRAARRRKVNDSINADRHVEMAPPLRFCGAAGRSCQNGRRRLR